jgi:hypothetical protein
MGAENSIGYSLGSDIERQYLGFPLSPLTSRYHIWDIWVVILEKLFPYRKIPDNHPFEFPNLTMTIIEGYNEIDFMPADHMAIKAFEFEYLLPAD